MESSRRGFSIADLNGASSQRTALPSEGFHLDMRAEICIKQLLELNDPSLTVGDVAYQRSDRRPPTQEAPDINVLC